MKKGLKFILSLLFILTIAISAFALSASASEEAQAPNLQITACTLSFDDSVYIMYALPIDSTAGAEVKMLYFTEAQDTLDKYNYENAKYRECHIGIQNVYGKNAYVYKNRHMNAKNMTDVVYARAYAKVGNTEYYSNLVKYSIEEYAFNTLGRIPASNPTANQIKLKELLETMLTYGAASQKYFNYKTGYLATDEYFKISVVGGQLFDCSAKGMYKENEQLTLTATPGDENTIVKWYDSQGILKGEGETLPVTVGTKSETYTAVREVILPDTYTVTFVDYDGEVLHTQSDIAEGESATAPEEPTRDGYRFVGWDTDFSSVTSDLTVMATYEAVKNQICVNYSVNEGELTATFSIEGDVDIACCDLYIIPLISGCELKSLTALAPLSAVNEADGEILFSFLATTNLTSPTELFSATFSVSEGAEISFEMLDDSYIFDGVNEEAVDFAPKSYPQD